MQHARRRCAPLIAASLAAVAVAAAACQHNAPQTGFVTVIITSSYSPPSLLVEQGTYVTWINQDSQPHTVTAVGAFDSGVIAPNGGRWTWPAAIIGTFTYHSLLQPSMTGTITVAPPSIR